MDTVIITVPWPLVALFGVLALLLVLAIVLLAVLGRSRRRLEREGIADAAGSARWTPEPVPPVRYEPVPPVRSEPVGTPAPEAATWPPERPAEPENPAAGTWNRDSVPTEPVRQWLGEEPEADAAPVGESGTAPVAEPNHGTAPAQASETETQPAQAPRPSGVVAFCPHCGRPAAEDFHFCPGCGGELPKTT